MLQGKNLLFIFAITCVLCVTFVVSINIYINNDYEEPVKKVQENEKSNAFGKIEVPDLSF